MKNKKPLTRFLIVFAISFVAIELVELLIKKLFNIDLHELKWGWAGITIIYGFKYHILCCLLPSIWAAYKCSHKDCKHDYCDADNVKN